MENQTLMPQIAQMLNIELNEEFKIHGMNNIFKLTERGLCDKHNNPCPNVLTALLSGKRTAYIPPFIPTSGDKYFHIALGKKYGKQNGQIALSTTTVLQRVTFLKQEKKLKNI